MLTIAQSFFFSVSLVSWWGESGAGGAVVCQWDSRMARDGFAGDELGSCRCMQGRSEKTECNMEKCFGEEKGRGRSRKAGNVRPNLTFLQQEHKPFLGYESLSSLLGGTSCCAILAPFRI